MLRRYLESTARLSPKELADSERLSLSLVGYHVRRLEELAAVELVGDWQRRGARQHFEITAKELLDLPLAPAPPGFEQAKKADASRRGLLRRIAELAPVIEGLSDLEQVVAEAKRLSRLAPTSVRSTPEADAPCHQHVLPLGFHEWQKSRPITAQSDRSRARSAASWVAEIPKSPANSPFSE